MGPTFKHIAITACLLFISFACGKDEDTTPETAAKIVIEPASRGVLQYLVEINDQLYWPENLPDEYKKPENNDLQIWVRYVLQEGQKEIFQPSPTDIPELAYTVPIIQILNIKRR